MAMFINVVKAKDLENVDGARGFSDPYISIWNPDTTSKWREKTGRVDNDLNPEFNQEFRMEVSLLSPLFSQ
jgi:Ca2+-dependent lipid-binding protein